MKSLKYYFSWSEKTREQKVIFLSGVATTIMVWFVLLSDYFHGQKTTTYFFVVFFMKGLQFVILNFFVNKDDLKNNIKVSTPYIGIWIAIYIFFFGKNEEDESD